MAGRSCYRDVLPFTAMVTMESTNVGLNTLFKAATNRGMSYHVFVVYSYSIAALALLPAPFISHRSRRLPPLNFSIMSKILLLGLIGSSSQIMGYTGISYSSPTLASAISNLVPAFTFILAIIFRLEEVALKSRSSQAKIIGTIVSLAGAFVVTLYKGPQISFTGQTQSLLLNSPASNPDWVIGGLLITAEYILVTLWYIVQARIMKEYPNELTVIFFYNVIVSIVAAIVGLITERDPNAWRLRPDMSLVSILCSGLLNSLLNNSVHTWTLRVKGPVYVTMFKPLSIAIAVVMGVTFLGDTLYLGSLLGAAIISVGFYTVLWGKAKEESGDDSGADSLESPSSNKAPLLQTYKTENV
ncbi:PREDICTED: WAT1-related protein At3g28050-like [Fragaria vesca subsp. vesca]|uniref:WAT1-related protein At3g28050-like n=1 Tax=Fragaria vesca subsp. vesca TaxID=101020 RepID=UPI0002C36D69|nr:PREDICTED: WAT1-related protein At3g28050-like [Fragaria vesca subsp. vesca]